MISQRSANLERVATFCGECSCGCPELWLDHDASEERRVVITDDFGQRVELSIAQLADLVADVMHGVLDNILDSASARRDAMLNSASARRDAMLNSASARRDAILDSASARRDNIFYSASARRDALLATSR